MMEMLLVGTFGLVGILLVATAVADALARRLPFARTGPHIAWSDNLRAERGVRYELEDDAPEDEREAA